MTTLHTQLVKLGGSDGYHTSASNLTVPRVRAPPRRDPRSLSHQSRAVTRTFGTLTPVLCMRASRESHPAQQGSEQASLWSLDTWHIVQFTCEGWDR